MKEVGEALSKAEKRVMLTSEAATQQQSERPSTVGQPHPHGQSAKEIKRKRNPNKSRKRLILAREFAMDRLKVSRQKKRSEEVALLMPLTSALQEDDIIE
ncbi:hypothetical protein LIER_39105 [Lithospermum erythrorhizon]|uniref:Uncharacterized protein n=1 Tax=Lithospermum erythrorhizon TaxID=34254 RepID=A0AAV3QCD1_LITER